MYKILPRPLLQMTLQQFMLQEQQQQLRLQQQVLMALLPASCSLRSAWGHGMVEACGCQAV
jgi:hypothetical protein